MSAGRAEALAEFIAKGMSLDEVRAALGGGSRQDAVGETLVNALVRHSRMMSADRAAGMWDDAYGKARAGGTTRSAA